MHQENNQQVITQISESSAMYDIAQEEPLVKSLHIGMEYAGGIIVHLDETGQHGLVCAPHDQGIFESGSVEYDFPYFPDMLGDGAINTQLILKHCDQRPIAASVCAELVLNGYSDWYLPSIGELFKVMKYLTSVECKSYTVGYYEFWSSSTCLKLNSEFDGITMGSWTYNLSIEKKDDTRIYSTYVSDNYTEEDSWGDEFLVRAVRRF
jgi:hypothetical protein